MKARIFIIEDEVADATLLQRAIKGVDDNINIEVFEDGDDALARLLPEARPNESGSSPDSQPSCILLDLKLRRMDGHAVLQALKEDRRTKRIPVVVLTSSSDPADVRLAYELGANSYLIKPVRTRDLGDMSGALVTYWLKNNHFPRSDDVV